MSWFRRQNSAATMPAAGGARSAAATMPLKIFEAELLHAGVYSFLGAEVEVSHRLDPEREYRIYVSPMALARSAPFFGGVPIVPEHDQEEDWLGVVLGGARYDRIDRCLKAQLMIWNESALQAIASGDRRSLSPKFEGPAVMQRGATRSGEEFDGWWDFDGGTHIALMADSRGTGRIGAEIRQSVNFDVALGDEGS
jgi:hypothetical protein